MYTTCTPIKLAMDVVSGSRGGYRRRCFSITHYELRGVQFSAANSNPASSNPGATAVVSGCRSRSIKRKVTRSFLSHGPTSNARAQNDQKHAHVCTDRFIQGIRARKKMNLPVVPTSVQRPKLLALCHCCLPIAICGACPWKMSDPRVFTSSLEPLLYESDSVSGAPA
jgi:hypothetical protein